MPTSWLPFYTEPLQMCFLSFISVSRHRRSHLPHLAPDTDAFEVLRTLPKRIAARPTTGSIVREDFDILKLQSAIFINHKVLGNTS